MKLSKPFKSKADKISVKYGTQQGVYDCPHCKYYHLTTKIENAEKYGVQLVYITPLPQS